jgi:glycosyltransferase involved in cell wall biosynthesis
VLSVNVHGPSTIVDDGETGWLVPPDDEEATAEAMVELVNDDDERRRRGEVAYEEARAHYSWPALVERLAKVYDEVREGKPPQERPETLT